MRLGLQTYVEAERLLLTWTINASLSNFTWMLLNEFEGTVMYVIGKP